LATCGKTKKTFRGATFAESCHSRNRGIADRAIYTPDPHPGSFLGTPVADWTRLLMTVLATKCMYEKGSVQSKQPPRPAVGLVWEWLRDPALTIFLSVTRAGWVFCPSGGSTPRQNGFERGVFAHSENHRKRVGIL